MVMDVVIVAKLAASITQLPEVIYSLAIVSLKYGHLYQQAYGINS